MKARVSEEINSRLHNSGHKVSRRPMRNLKEAGIKFAAQTKVNLRKAGSMGEKAVTIKTQYPIRK